MYDMLTTAKLIVYSMGSSKVKKCALKSTQCNSARAVHVASIGMDANAINLNVPRDGSPDLKRNQRYQLQ